VVEAERVIKQYVIQEINGSREFENNYISAGTGCKSKEEGEEKCRYQDISAVKQNYLFKIKIEHSIIYTKLSSFGENNFHNVL
jgi:hypothetical protein